jgi:ABC-2 type transport system permease protein
MALIFVGVFLAATLFTFFWVDTFFARGLADVRPMFRWMPTLMIFLVAALTMRQWSEEQQTGTLEMLFTLPMKLWQLVIGKFLAVVGLVVVALALTAFLPVTISFFGNPDPGPIVGGYLAAVLMASAYAAIGLFISSRTKNQIVALIVTVLVCGLFQLVGSQQITGLVNAHVGQILRAFGTGSRFESIERGVLDLRDLLYYVSLTVVFLVLNVFSLDNKRWGIGDAAKQMRFNSKVGVTLLAVNLLAFNVLLYPFHSGRLDLTADRQYSLSGATKDLLGNLQEPLIVRGYFSKDNHPLLSPLIPTIEDMLEEYKIASNGKMDLKILDPIDDPETEAEANQVYGIQPTPLQVSERSGASVLNVYFDILIRYGDQSTTLNFQDLIDVTQYGNDVDVHLKNLEYDLTRSIRKVVYGFQSIDAVLATLSEPAQLTFYYTPSTLPDSLADAPDTIQTVAQGIADASDGKLVFTSVNMDDASSNVDPQQLYNQYGIQPIATGFLSADTYYLYMVASAAGKNEVIYPSSTIAEADVRSSIEGALQRIAPGFLKVVGLWTSADQQDEMAAYYGQSSSLQAFDTVSQMLGSDYDVQTIDLTTGQVPDNIDLLMLIGPKDFTDIERYAVDQYLMRGGTVVVMGGSYDLGVDQMMGTLALVPIENGLQDMLASYGVTVEPTVVMDTQNAPFPVQVARNAGGVTVQEIQAIDYPYFVNVRASGMDRDNPILGSLASVTLNWASPLTVDADKNANRQVTTLLKSSANAWTTDSPSVEPNFTLYPELGFPAGSDQQSYPLAVVIEGSFDSYFKDKESPFAAATETPADTGTGGGSESAPAAPVNGPIASSPDTARLIVIGSSEFLNDNVMQTASRVDQESYTNDLQLVENVVDWSTEDTDLLAIRSRGESARLLDPLSDHDQRFWEGLNYGFALVSLLALGGLWQWRKRTEKPMALVTVPVAATPEVHDDEQD